MFEHPFSVLLPFGALSVMMLTKADDVADDAGIAKTLGAQQLASLWQMHGRRTIRVRTPTSHTEQADGLLTDVPGLTLTIRAADCQTYCVYALPSPSRSPVVGLLHASWRGLAAGAIPAFFDVLRAEWGIAPGETIVAAGPSLCVRCAEFTDPARELPADWAPFIEGRHADLQAIADAQLKNLGVRADRFERHPDCTRCLPERYWTYRGGDREAVLKGSTNVLACRIG